MEIQKNRIDFDSLKIRKYKLYKPKKVITHPVCGLDTETYQGYAKLIADSDGSYKDVENLDDVLEFLTNRKYEGKHNFFFNIRFDFQALFKYLSKEKLIELYNTSKTVIDDYKLKYIPKKYFRVNKGKHSCSFYDIFVFYEASLETCAKKYLSMKKNEVGIDSARLNVDKQYWDDNLYSIQKYCVSDAVITQKLGVFLQHELSEKLDFIPQKYVSKAGLAKEYFRKHCNIPDLKGIPLEAISYAFNSYKGGRFEVLKKGFFEHSTLIDINSAYPYQIASLCDYSQGRWVKVRDVDLSSLYGFYLCKVDIPYMSIAPLTYHRRVPVSCFPCGEFSTFLTLEEIKAYSRYIDIKVVSGWECHGNGATQPFKDIIELLYDYKKNTPKSDFRYDLAKKMMNSIPGAFYEKYKNDGAYLTGILFNPILASPILANTRIELFKEALKHKKDVVAFATDSVLFDREIQYEEDSTLGGWSIANSGEAVVLRSGMYLIGDELKSRGLQKNTDISTPEGDYNNIFEYFRANPESSDCAVHFERPINLGEALTHVNTYSVEDINVWCEFEYVININRDYKRKWNDSFTCGGDLFERSIDSEPFIVGNGFDEKVFGRQVDGAKALDYMRRMDMKRAKEMRYSDVAKDIDPDVTTRHGKDLEIMNEMKRYLNEERFFMEER